MPESLLRWDVCDLALAAPVSFRERQSDVRALCFLSSDMALPGCPYRKAIPLQHLSQFCFNTLIHLWFRETKS